MSKHANCYHARTRAAYAECNAQAAAFDQAMRFTDVVIEGAQDTADAEAEDRLVTEYFDAQERGIPASDEAYFAYTRRVQAAQAWQEMDGDSVDAAIEAYGERHA